MSRFHGQLSLRAAPGANRQTILAEQAFRAPFHLSKPYWDYDAETLLVQVVNPTAGILSGDRLESAVKVDAGASLLLTTPSASRIFRMRSGEAGSEQGFQVEREGYLDVLPEPLVPHAGSRFHQRTNVVVEPGATVFYSDLLMPGRVAHGEAWAWDRLVLELAVTQKGNPVLRERFSQSGAELREQAEFVGAGLAACFGNAVVISAALETDESWRTKIHALQNEQVWIGASPLHGEGVWSIKFVATDGIRLRATLAAIRRILSDKVPRLAFQARKL